MPLYWIALNAVKGLGPVRIKQLLSHYESPEAVFKESSSGLKKAGLLPDGIGQIHNPKLLQWAQEQLDKAQKQHIHILTLADDEYPPLLREIFAPPPVLYIKGSKESFSPHSIAVVGTRHHTTYGKNAAAIIVEGLAKSTITVISGLALGIDSIAHKTCVEQGGTTIAVLGCGVDTCYPPSNGKLAEHIEKQGAIVSEFPLGTRPLAYNFPRRNRIISGLSAGVVVVEAAKKSGSLITAHYAMQQGRDVFAVPGSIFSEKSIGTFNLIKTGATPVQSAQDILECIEIVTHTLRPETISRVTQFSPELLNAEERPVVETLSDEPQRIDQISERVKKTTGSLFSILLNLELKGVIKQVAGQQYVRI